MIDIRYPEFIFTTLHRGRKDIISQPCIYAWLRQETALYIGMSMRGTIRPFSSHHIINTIEPFLEHEDCIFVWRMEQNTKKIEVYLIEQELIRVYQPKYNCCCNGVIINELPQEYLEKRISEIKFGLKEKAPYNPFEGFKLFGDNGNSYYNIEICVYCKKPTIEKDYGCFCSDLCRQLYRLRGPKNEM